MAQRSYSGKRVEYKEAGKRNQRKTLVTEDKKGLLRKGLLQLNQVPVARTSRPGNKNSRHNSKNKQT